ncbi:hypothetical protein EV648_105357 [Kribbella sp. VKM Ac-2568]|nr:hypothetical protein EV648_105357 [Kribbella sp. VKM Ac-2568]
MMKTTGLYPCVRVDAAGSGVVSQAGGLLLTEAVRVSGLGAERRERWCRVAQAVGPARPGQDRHRSGDRARVGWELPGRHRGAARRAGRVRPGRLRSDGVPHDRRAGRRRRAGAECDQCRPGGGPRAGVGAGRRYTSAPPQDHFRWETEPGEPRRHCHGRPRTRSVLHRPTPFTDRGDPPTQWCPADQYTAVAETTDHGCPIRDHLAAVARRRDHLRDGSGRCPAGVDPGRRLRDTSARTCRSGICPTTPSGVELYLQESLTFLALTAESSVVLIS